MAEAALLMHAASRGEDGDAESSAADTVAASQVLVFLGRVGPRASMFALAFATAVLGTALLSQRAIASRLSHDAELHESLQALRVAIPSDSSGNTDNEREPALSTAYGERLPQAPFPGARDSEGVFSSPITFAAVVDAAQGASESSADGEVVGIAREAPPAKFDAAQGASESSADGEVVGIAREGTTTSSTARTPGGNTSSTARTSTADSSAGRHQEHEGPVDTRCGNWEELLANMSFCPNCSCFKYDDSSGDCYLFEGDCTVTGGEGWLLVRGRAKEASVAPTTTRTTVGSETSSLNNQTASDGGRSQQKPGALAFLGNALQEIFDSIFSATVRQSSAKGRDTKTTAAPTSVQASSTTAKA